MSLFDGKPIAAHEFTSIRAVDFRIPKPTVQVQEDIRSIERELFRKAGA